jgi:hypothetical protein
MRFFLRICCTAIVVCLIPASLQDTIRAEVSDPAADAASAIPATEPPPSRVGRLSLVSGDIELRGAGETSWVDATLNQPVITGQAVRAGRKARGEIEIGPNTIDLSNNTEIEITRLSDELIQLALSRGRIGLALRQLGDGETVEIDFPQGVVRLLGPGRYDIDAGRDEHPSRIAVFDGAVRFVGNGAEARVEAGQMAVLTSSDAVAANIEPAKPDGFVEWCRGRDYDDTRLAAPYYVSPYITGLAELDPAGSWKISADYGPVWFPADPEWAPYRFGHWSWMTPWGWTWIDDRPWGFAVSHYGRWALIDERWAWLPGSFVAHPLFAPAVVAFLGTPGIGLSSEDGATVAWFPLAPSEAYWPAYTRDVDYVHRLNFGNVQNVGAIGLRADGEPPLELFHTDFVNRQLATVVPRSTFVNGHAVAPVRVTLPEQRLRNAPVLMASPQIAPPSAQPVVRVVPPAAKPTATRVTGGAFRKAGAKSIHAALIKPHGREPPMVIRAAHLHVPSYAGQAHRRQLIVLRGVHNPHGAVGKGATLRVLRR